MEVQENNFNMAILKFQNWLYQIKVQPDLSEQTLREVFFIEDEVLYATSKNNVVTIHCNSAKGKFNYKRSVSLGHKDLGKFTNISTKILRKKLKCSTL